jgi:hypothetical protein
MAQLAFGLWEQEGISRQENLASKVIEALKAYPLTSKKAQNNSLGSQSVIAGR